MNGRLYDPLLRRFLNADEHIQDPYNTQNYNKYGYVYNNPLMYNDPSGEIFFFAALAVALKSTFWAGVVAGAIGGAIIGGSLYIGQAFFTGNFSLEGFAKAFFGGALTGAVAGALGQVFSAGTFWATVGNGALAGAGAGGMNALINGQNFLEGLVKGAVIGGAMGAISYGVGKLFTKKEYHDFPVSDNDISNVSNNTNLTTADAKETWNKNWKSVYNSTKDAKPAYLMEKGVAPKGYSHNLKTGVFDGLNGKKAMAVTETVYEKGVAVRHRLYMSNSAFSSKEQLNYVMNHEFGHMVLNNNYGDAFNKVIGTGLLDTQAHRAIQKIGQGFLRLNGWSVLKIKGASDSSFLGNLQPEYALLKQLEKLIIKIK